MTLLAILVAHPAPAFAFVDVLLSIIVSVGTQVVVGTVGCLVTKCPPKATPTPAPTKDEVAPDPAAVTPAPKEKLEAMTVDESEILVH